MLLLLLKTPRITEAPTLFKLSSLTSFLYFIQDTSIRLSSS